MAFDGNGQAFQDLKLLIAEYATAKSNISTLQTNVDAWETTALEATGKLQEHRPLYDSGVPAFAYGGEVARMDSAVLAAGGPWLRFILAYCNANAIPINDTSVDGVLRGLIVNMEQDSAAAEDVDASVPTIGAVSYYDDNQGDGTATITLNTNDTLKELGLTGKVILRCIRGGFAVQNAETWQLIHRATDPRTLAEVERFSPSLNLKTGTQYEDVIYLVNGKLLNGYEYGQAAPAKQVPQRGRSIMTGCVVNISTPSYNSVSQTDDGGLAGDQTTIWDNFNLKAKVGTKTNVTRKNTTFAYNGASRNGTIYMRHQYTAGAPDTYDVTFYQDAAFAVALTDTQTISAGDGDSTISWATASTNPEAASNGGFLVDTSGSEDTFIQADLDESDLHTYNADFTLPIAVNLPWAVGDEIYATITNGGAGVIEDFFVREMGLALPADTGGTETITDP